MDVSFLPNSKWFGKQGDILGLYDEQSFKVKLSDDRIIYPSFNSIMFNNNDITFTPNSKWFYHKGKILGLHDGQSFKVALEDGRIIYPSFNSVNFTKHDIFDKLKE